MFDINRHKFFLVSILKDIYADAELANALGFKGGTAHMLFYQLPRFSVDLDFNLLQRDKESLVFVKIRKILSTYGVIKDEPLKHFGLLLVLNYGDHERNLKVEISNREYPDRYELKNYMGIAMKVMQKPDMFAHKLCAIMDRSVLTNRDIFDVYFFMSQKTPVNKEIIENRMGVSYKEYLSRCIEYLENTKNHNFLNGLGELLDDELKKNVRNKMKNEVLQYLAMYREFPIFA